MKQDYKKTSLGIIPNEWEVVKLGDVCKFYKGKGISKKDISENGINCIRYGELYTTYNEKIDKVYSRTNLNIDGLFLSKFNDIIIASSGETAIDISKASCVLLDNVALGGDLNVLRTKENGIFISYYLNHIVKNEIAKLAQGVSIVHLYASDLKNLKIVLPPLKEQIKIAEILSEFDTAINLMSNLISQKTKFKKALMQNLLTAKIRFPNFKDKWQEVSLDKIVFYQEGPGVRNTQYRKKGVKLLNVSNLNNNQLNLSTTTTYINKELAYGKYKHFLVDEGDLLISCSGINSESFKTKIAFAKKEHLPLCMNTSTMRFKNLDDSLSLKYLYYFFQTLNFEKQVFSILTGSAQFNFGPTHIKWFKIKLPNLDEQKKIAEILSSIDDEINLLNLKLKNLKDLKKGVMQNLLTGKVRVDG
ncbi:hypothetical protein F1B92_04275 [Campylobacter sp. FMV-PI01]|uniref:Type I restriction modification DNA specificity domain-containing protein n=1 Tax=Campylobacter portucalensis TaxID=2608384 RepID=A0A6L5WKM8_9BACT|nr:restriction endonuclease subunit S [Campylobacter portucalensis]MSN96403.1 hypothetical protein [Campylobacter portucalensis]